MAIYLASVVYLCRTMYYTFMNSVPVEIYQQRDGGHRDGVSNGWSHETRIFVSSESPFVRYEVRQTRGWVEFVERRIEWRRYTRYLASTTPGGIQRPSPNDRVTVDDIDASQSCIGGRVYKSTLSHLWLQERRKNLSISIWMNAENGRME